VLFPAQGTVNTTAVEPPINADGSSSWPSARGEVPIKFALFTSPAPAVFESVISSSPSDVPFSFLEFVPGGPLTFSQISNLSANYTFAAGDCGGGSLRWQVAVDLGGNITRDIFIYYGDYPNFTTCTGFSSQSGQNMIGKLDLRYDTSQIPGGTFYDSYAHALTLVGNDPVVAATLVVDSGWFDGPQVLGDVSHVTVNDNTFVPLSTAPMATCTLPPASIKVTMPPSTTPLSGVTSVQSHDDPTVFRTVDCKYIYNLDISSLKGAGKYRVQAVIGSVPAAGAAQFSLR